MKAQTPDTDPELLNAAAQLVERVAGWQPLSDRYRIAVDVINVIAPRFDADEEARRNALWEAERQRARDWIAEWFCEPDDGTPDYHLADTFIARLDRQGYAIVPTFKREQEIGAWPDGG